jgi:uncharacterized protein YdhG (YjbR/CyaY superfamily)
MAGKPATIDDFLAGVSAEQRGPLEELRALIKSEAPEATEHISYGIPTFKLAGKPLVGFGATRSHCAFYLMSSSVLEGFRDELGARETGKGTIRFQPGDPPPADLVRRLVRARIAENAA